jgi:transketolase
MASSIRAAIVNMMHYSKSSHIGSCLSIVDILYVLYFRYLVIDPSSPRMPERDRFILSKAHGSAALYAVLAKRGFFSEKLLDAYCIDGGRLPGHLARTAVPGVEASAGSLGHGLPIAVGMALAAKMRREQHRIVCLLGDGECNEGSVWEAVMFATANALPNLTLIVDHNMLQGLGRNVLKLDELSGRFRAFGCEAYDIDGHQHDEILSVLNIPQKAVKAVVAHTVKGKGVSFMEDRLEWHYKSPNDAEKDAALKELGI